MRKFYFLVFLVAVVVSCGKKKDDSFFTYSRFGAGDYIVVEYEKKAGNLDSEIHSILSEADASVVASNEGSFIAGVNRNDSSGTMNKTLYELLNISSRFYKESKGLFDPTAGIFETYWNRDLRKYLYQAKIDSASIDSLRRFSGFNKIGFTGAAIRKADPKIQLDFKNIYRGYVVDKISAMLDSYKISNYKIEFGGRVKAAGKNPKGKSWQVGIDDPVSDNKTRKMLAFTDLNNESIVTAGNYRDHYSNLDKKLPFTIDPLTGYPVKHTLLSVTVIHSSATDADGYANSFLVMGPELTKAYLASHPDLKVYMISTNYKGEWVTYMTDALREKVKMIKEELPI